MGFVAVLSWSRQIFLRFYLGAHMENFLRGHVDAFSAGRRFKDIDDLNAQAAIWTPAALVRGGARRMNR